MVLGILVKAGPEPSLTRGRPTSQFWRRGRLEAALCIGFHSVVEERAGDATAML